MSYTSNHRFNETDDDYSRDLARELGVPRNEHEQESVSDTHPHQSKWQSIFSETEQRTRFIR